GIDYGDYIEQITYLLFLKMADERNISLPKGCDWPTLRDYAGTELTEHYIDILRSLGKAPGLLGDIYAGEGAGAGAGDQQVSALAAAFTETNVPLVTVMLPWCTNLCWS